jgi:hypothetical protein
MKIGKDIITKKLSIYLALMIMLTAMQPANAVTADTLAVSGSAIEYTSPTPTPEVSTTPEPEPSVTTYPIPTVTTAPELTLTPSPEPTSPADPIITPELTPTPTPEPTKVPYRSNTLEKMSKYDYVGKSVTGISKKQETVKTLQSWVKSYGSLYGTGMPYAEYKAAMSYEWTDVTQYDKKPSKIKVDITQSMNYDSYESILKKLSRYDGVYLYKIGESTEGRDLYAIEIDVESDYKKNVIMMTGQIHAREFGGGTFIVKQFVDLVQKAQTDEKAMELLKKNKFVAVPIINVDGREALITSQKKWTTGGGQLWKGYTNGTDGGRNFPGLQWGQVQKGSKYKSIIAKKPAYANYPGSYAGSNNETKAMMKWLYHYTVVEQADFYLDMHQQGSIIYAGKTWQTKKQEQKSRDLRTNVLSVVNKGITKRKYTRVYEGSAYGMQGEGSSLTDYAITLAIGAKFSPAYGFSAFTDGKKEYILMQVKDLDQSKLKIKEANKDFGAITMEIGYGTKYLGNSASTRRLLANEYNYYNFGKLLETLPTLIK